MLIFEKFCRVLKHINNSGQKLMHSLLTSKNESSCSFLHPGTEPPLEKLACIDVYTALHDPLGV